MNTRLFLLGISFFITSMLAGQSIRFYQIEDLTEYGKVLDLTEDEGKLMLFVIFRDDGGFEEMIREDIFEDDSVKKAFDDLVPVAVFRSSEMAMRMLESFGEKSIPTFYIMNTEEFLLNAAYGRLSKNELLDFIAAGMELGNGLDELKSDYYAHKLSKQEWVSLIGLYELNFDFLSTQDLALEFLSEVGKDGLLNDTVKPVSLSYAINLETPYPKAILEQKDQLDSAEFADYYSSAYSFNFDLAVVNEDTSLLDKIIKLLIPEADAEDSVKEEMIMETQKLFARETGHFEVWKDAVLEQCSGIEAIEDKAEYAFDEAFDIAEEYNSESAQKAARSLAARASQWKEDYRYYMLESYMAYLMQDYDEALNTAQKAKGLAENEADVGKAERLQNIIRSGRETE